MAAKIGFAKRYALIVAAVLICFMSACSPKQNTAAKSNILDSGKYYRVYKTGCAEVGYEIFDKNGKTVLSNSTDRPLKINAVAADIVDISEGFGTGIVTHKYYNAAKNTFSKEFSYVVANQGETAAFIDIDKNEPLKNRKLVVCNVFDSDLFYKEFCLDFSAVDTPIIKANFLQNGSALTVEYLSGGEQSPKTEVLSLE